MAIRLFIVDDAEDARFLVRVILDETPEVEIVGEADGAVRALEQLEDAAPDVVLLDAVMPRMDGYDLAPLVRERLPRAKLVLLTAHVDEVVRRRAEGSGIDRVLGKDEYERLSEVVIELGGAP